MKEKTFNLEKKSRLQRIGMLVRVDGVRIDIQVGELERVQVVADDTPNGSGLAVERKQRERMRQAQESDKDGLASQSGGKVAAVLGELSG